jgi:sugar-specific transcriptional regulator TrmB
MKGMRQEKQPSSKSKIRELETLLKNSQMSLQVTQMMIKHLSDQVKALQKDVGSSMGMLNDLQYRTLALLEVGNFDKIAVNTSADVFKLNDFNKMSDKEDVEKKYLVDEAGIVKEDSIVIVTTNTPSLPEDQGIFRSKFPMSECIAPNLRDALLGAKVGDTLDVDIYGVNHSLTILGLRKVEQVQSEDATEANE